MTGGGAAIKECEFPIAMEYHQSLQWPALWEREIKSHLILTCIAYIFASYEQSYS